MTCLDIIRGILPDCDVPATEGVKAKIWIIPKSDYDNATIVMNALFTETDVIQSITLALGAKQAYVFEGYKNSQQMSVVTKEREFAVPVFTHQWQGIIIPRNVDDKVTLERLIRSRFVLIVENNDKGEDGELAFELYGASVGLSHMESTQVKNENAGGWSVTFATPETESEPKIPISIYDTDYATTKDMVVLLETPTGPVIP